MQENGTIDEECSRGGLGRAHSKGRLRLGDDGVLRFVNYRGRVTRRHPLGIKEELLVVLPRSLRRRMLLLVHDSPLSGHMGQDRTWERARRAAWWPYMKKDVVAYVQGCDRCQLHKRKKLPGRAPLQNTDIPRRPLNKVQIDFCGPFHKSVPDGMEYVLAIQDALSRYCILVPTKDCRAETAAPVFRERWVCPFGIPLIVQSDRGTHFTAVVFEETCRALGIDHRMSSPNHSQSQGQVERQNQLMDIMYGV